MTTPAVLRAVLLTLSLGSLAFVPASASAGPAATTSGDAATVKDFEDMAESMRANFKPSNRCSPGHSNFSWLSPWQADTAQMDKIKALKIHAQVIYEDERAKKKKADAGGGGGTSTAGSSPAPAGSPTLAAGDTPIAGGGAGGGGGSGYGGPYHAGLRSTLRYADLVDDVWVGGFHVGNCGEMAPVALARLYNQYPDAEFNLVYNKTGDHAFVLARLPSGDTYAVDPWKGHTTGPFIFSKGKLFTKGTTDRSTEYDYDLVTYTAPDGRSFDVDSGWVSKNTHGVGATTPLPLSPHGAGGR